MSLFVCPKHGLHHGPFCRGCPEDDQHSQWWDGTFADTPEKPDRPDTHTALNPSTTGEAE